MADWKAAELAWGRGPRVFEMFLEPTCPYSKKALGKIKEVLSAVGEDRITVKIRLQSQPRHLYSGVIVRAILAASTLDNGREAAWRVMEAVAAPSRRIRIRQALHRPQPHGHAKRYYRADRAL
jgi:hypothetical protein